VVCRANGGRMWQVWHERRLGGELLRSYPDDFVAALKRNPNTEHSSR